MKMKTGNAPPRRERSRFFRAGLVLVLIASTLVVAPVTVGAQDAAPAPVPDDAVAGFPIDLGFVGLEPLGDGFVYEGWVVVDGAPVSTGRFTIAEIDGERTYVGPNLASQSDLDNASDFVLTIEPAVGDDPAPAAAKPLGGAIVDGVAELTHAHPAALGDDFSSAAGQFIIATPTTADNADDDYSGVWFIEVTEDGPVAGLDLPTLPEGWVYEGWAVIEGQPVSTGRFVDPGAPDDFGGFSGPDPNPPFPGEDFIVNAPDGLTFPTDLTNGGTIVLSIEPEDDDSPAPFAFKPLAASVDGAPLGTAIELGAGPGFPSGTATIGAPATDTPPAEPASGAVVFTVENVQPADGFFFTPVWAGLHSGEFELFNSGERVTNGLEILAETGDTAPLSDEFAAPGRLQTTISDGPIGPGAVVEGSIDIINAAAYRYLSFASMIIPSNDAFFGDEGPGGYELFDENGAFTGPVTIEILGSELYDAGTEENTAQGAAGFSLGFDGLGSGESTDDPDGVAAVHPGFENLVGLQTAAGTTIGSAGSGGIDADEVVAIITIDIAAEAPPVDDAPVDDAPVDDAPVDDAPVDDAPVDDAPVDDAPVDDAPAAPESFRIVDQNFGRYLEASFGNASTTDVAHTTTAWQLVDAGDGYYIQNAYTGRFLSTDGSNAGLSDAGDDYILWQLVDAGDGSYYIVNASTEALLNADRPGFNVNTSTMPGASTQWVLMPAE